MERIKPHEIEVLRRSLVMSATLPRGEVARLLATTGELLAERREMQRLVGEIGSGAVATNESITALREVLHGPRLRR